MAHVTSDPRDPVYTELVVIKLTVLCCAEVHNMTAENIIIPPFVLPPLPTLKGILNHRVGDKLLESDNRFQQELLLGSKLVHQPNEDSLLISPDVFYKKHVRKEVPPVIVEPRDGDDDDDDDDDDKSNTAVMWRRGMRRWTALPDIVEVCCGLCYCQSTERAKISRKFYFK